MSDNWNYTLIDDAVTKGSSNISLNKIKDDNGDYPVYSAKGFAKNVSFYHQEKEYLAIIKDGAGVGRVSKHPKKSSIVATMQYLIPNEGYNIDFVKYFLESIKFESYIKGSTIPNIYFKDYKSHPFPNINLPEQKQIVETLDQAFEKIDKAIANIKRNIQNAEELFQSKLDQIFSQIGEGWEENKLLEVTTKIGSGATPRGGKSSYKKTGVSLIRSMNVYDYGFKQKNLAFIDDEQAAKLNNVIVEQEDILLNITGASVARCCIIPKEYLPARVNQHVSIIRLNNKIIPSFAHYFLISNHNKKLLLEIGEKGGSTRQAITKSQIHSLRGPKLLFRI